jgi:hypothetical protein
VDSFVKLQASVSTSVGNPGMFSFTSYIGHFTLLAFPQALVTIYKVLDRETGYFAYIGNYCISKAIGSGSDSTRLLAPLSNIMVESPFPIRYKHDSRDMNETRRLYRDLGDLGGR